MLRPYGFAIAALLTATTVTCVPAATPGPAPSLTPTGALSSPARQAPTGTPAPAPTATAPLATPTPAPVTASQLPVATSDRREEVTVTATITAIDVVARQISVRLVSDAIITIQVTGETAISANGRGATLSDLQVGDIARIELTQAGNVAFDIETSPGQESGRRGR